MATRSPEETVPLSSASAIATSICVPTGASSSNEPSSAATATTGRVCIPTGSATTSAESPASPAPVIRPLSVPVVLCSADGSGASRPSSVLTIRIGIVAEFNSAFSTVTGAGRDSGDRSATP